MVPLETLTSPDVQHFMREHALDDPHQLALQAHRYPDLPIPAIAEQLQARRKAQPKLPEWWATEGLIFPPTLSMEQCSSEAMARYKSSLLRGQRLVDLTGGAGVDTYYLSQSFAQTDYVEQNEGLANLAQHNFSVLGASSVRVHAVTAEAFLNNLSEPVDVIYLDPARRDAQARRVFQLADSTPDVLALQDELLTKATNVLLKTAPLLDIQATLQVLKNVSQVHVVAVRNEVKEVLYRMEQRPTSEPQITAVNLQSSADEPFSFLRSEETQAEVTYAEPMTYLYEPHAALMKAGAFKLIGQRFGLSKLHPNTHLYTSNQLVQHFPGRAFRCQAVVPYQKKAVRKQLSDAKANIAARNFPNPVATVRKKLGLDDGGDAYLFAVRLANEQLRIIVTAKVT
ncbi:MAG: class I SAM-dependent methyltransferase [Tunicatimonas sp.]